jgi:hypothetical protein
MSTLYQSIRQGSTVICEPGNLKNFFVFDIRHTSALGLFGLLLVEQGSLLLSGFEM